MQNISKVKNKIDSTEKKTQKNVKQNTESV